MRLMLASSLTVAILTSTAAAQLPQLGPALAPPGDLGSLEAGGVQHAPRLAAGDGTALAVWIDHRAEFHSPLQGEGGPDVFAMRVGTDGQPMDPVALRLPTAPGDKEEVRAAWNGSAWLVVWENQDTFGGFNTRHILGARVSGDGVLLDTQPLVIKDDFSTTSGTLTLSSDGVGWLLTVQGLASSSAGIGGFRIGPDGSVLNPGGTLITTISTAMGNGDVEYADGVYLLAFSPGSPTRGLRFDDTLTPLGGLFTIGSGTSSRPRVATDGSDFLVAWENSTVGGRNIRARHIDAATGAQSAVLQITPVSNGDFNWTPDVAWSGALWTVICTDTNADAFRFARITPELVLRDPGGVILPGVTATVDSRAELAGLSGATSVVFETVDLSQNWDGAVESARVTDTLVVEAPTPLSLSATRQGFPSLVAGDDQFLAVFTAEQDETMVIEAQRFDPFGQALDAEPIELAAGNRFGEPKAAFNGEHYLVVWEDRQVLGFETDDLVLGMRLGLDGVPLDAAPLTIMGGGKPDVAANDGVFLVVSSHAPSDPHIRRPFAQRVAGDGSLVGTPLQLGNSFSRYPRVAALGAGFLATWQRHSSHDNPPSSVRAIQVGTDGSLSAELFVGGQSRPDVASAGDRALLVFHDNSVGVGGRIVETDGSLGGVLAIAPLPALPSLPVVSWSGEDYLVTWTDYRELVGFWDSRGDIYAARVSADGVVLDPGGGFPVAESEDTEYAATTAGAFGAHLLGYDALLPDAPHATMRLVLRRESPWSSLGGGAVGTTAPLMLGRGDLVGGGGLAFAVSGGPANAPGALIAGLSAVALPFKGGTLVAAPDVVVPLAADAQGRVDFAIPLPATVPGGLQLALQTWLADGGAPAGFVGSNGVVATAP